MLVFDVTGFEGEIGEAPEVAGAAEGFEPRACRFNERRVSSFRPEQTAESPLQHPFVKVA
jgi:hypothetical protein